MKKIDNSPLKAVKTVCVINTSLTALTAVLLDIPATADWVYATKKITVLKKLSASELIYYSELNIPWPVTNRDFIVLLTVTQDQKTKAVTVLGDNKPDYVPAYKNIVRIQKSYSKWLITPLQNGQVKIEYILEVDPGGAVPAWLINLFAGKGPYETFKKLREQVKETGIPSCQPAFYKRVADIPVCMNFGKVRPVSMISSKVQAIKKFGKVKLVSLNFSKVRLQNFPKIPPQIALLFKACPL